MLRLLSDDALASDPTLRRELRADRRRLFREYLQALIEDYSRLLADVRLLMVQSDTERPDLAKLLVRSRISFAITLCRIDFCLLLHALGIGKSDVSGLVDSLNVLRTQAITLIDSTVWGS
jgi:hypothetical protein